MTYTTPEIQTKLPYIPQEIRTLVENQPCTTNSIGMSDSTVLMFPDSVLKIQKTTAETRNEVEIISWVKKQNSCVSHFNDPFLPFPKIIKYIEENNISYTLQSRIHGKMLCDDEYLSYPETLINMAAAALKSLWAVDVKDCPVLTVSPLKQRLKYARYLVENHLEETDVEPETYGPNGFKNPQELLEWLEANHPEEDIVMTHGDFCLPNIFANGNKLAGFIDLGKAGPADRWQDIAIAIRSIHHNLNGTYGGKKIMDFTPDMLLDKLGIPMDEKKYKYYLLLDELF